LKIAITCWIDELAMRIGQTGAESRTVLADPESNEFCMVRTKETLIR